MTQALQDLGILALGTRFRVLSENMMATVKAFYDEHKLDFEPRWFPLFRTVHKQPGIGMMALSQQLGVSHAAVNAFCKQLVEAGLIELTPAPTDGRIKQVTLTASGQVLHTRLEPAWFVLRQALETAFPGETADQTLQLLARLEEAVDDRAIPRGLKTVLKRDRLLEGLEIRPYDPAMPDNQRYFEALNTEWLEHYFTVEPVDRQMFADPVGLIIAPGGAIYMAAVHGQIVGTCALVKRSDDMYELAKMAVSTVFQGKGIGTALVAAVEDHARSLGLTKLYLVSSVKLPHAVPTYRKLGYVDSATGLHELYQRSDISLEKVLVS
ncbi:bifunctional helix-turn-helix transcriptional regulator/GNAT family N-acetyltransferase [Asticcacaulis biprosthecium]|uniref:bifunctional helix-turn-helix transcriptional regulator/GNAT family N-acetyltransferase n=1 Tax=Asticcacaulis biprosthecium TaxID=76891 RepID=UPI0009FBC7E7|nr:helix-turn-helix domain-containing GNAT family N-acetyltransferase [Asticcacaulis biprosthecium]